MRGPLDVAIAGGGPAGALAALVLSRAGARVRIFDRARFPRHKLCGDTVNPGALAVLVRLGMADVAGALPVEGMLVTGERGVRIAGRYPDGMTGRAIQRRELDYALLMAAVRAGAQLDDEVLVRGATVTGNVVDGLSVATRDGATRRVNARLVIAADGRHSRVGRSLRLSWFPRAPRRWAIGAYFSDARGLTECGEMHIRRERYIGVAPLPGGLANACVVTADRRGVGNPVSFLQRVLRTEPELSERFSDARLVGRPVVLGPLAVECRGAGAPGLLLAGDAAGFIDPMTGDGLRFALRGAELAAQEALHALEHGNRDAYLRLHATRFREFRTKWRFNRILRSLAGSPAAVSLAAAAASVVPSLVEGAIRYAGDVDVARVGDAHHRSSPECRRHSFCAGGQRFEEDARIEGRRCS
jgi:flavin-dependent dehydrogenase